MRVNPLRSAVPLRFLCSYSSSISSTAGKELADNNPCKATLDPQHSNTASTQAPGRLLFREGGSDQNNGGETTTAREKAGSSSGQLQRIDSGVLRPFGI